MTTRVPTLIRTHHTIGRAAEYFTARELQAQTGQRRTMFSAVVLKELVDNALDAAESTGVAPEISISIDRRGGDLEIAVRDNGPGLPAAVVTKTLDFDVRTSDKRAYRSPTRGAQGNALKTIIGVPTALGSSAPIVIEACNVRHTIQPRIDTAGNVDPGHTTEAIPVTTGTRIAVTLPTIDQELDAVSWARAFALANPHATVKITDSDESRNHAYCETFDAPDSYRTWRKWVPTDPTSPHWYDGPAFQTLIDAEVASARHAGRESRLVRDFVRDFRGLSATAKAKTVCATVPNATHLADLNGEAGTLLAAMRAEAKPAKPDVLGSVGEEHIRSCLAAWHGIVHNRFWYKRITGIDAGLPFVVEAAIAETDEPGLHITAINFSPTFREPLAESRLSAGKAEPGFGIGGFMSNCFVRRGGASTSFVHIVHPALAFLDRGKSTIAPSSALLEAVGQALWHTAKTIHAEEERRRKDAARAQRARESWTRAATREAHLSLKDAAFTVMEQAWAQATDHGSGPASARAIYYQARPLVQAYTDETLEDTYFTQTLLPAYQREVRELPNVYYEPRGTLHEPHTGRAVPLGTREVAGYTIPDWTYDKILFVEKQGQLPRLQAARLAERYDMAIIAGQGYASVACRELLARAQQDCQILVLHDADIDGYSISETIREETRRMPGHQVEVIDIGLTIETSERLGLAAETFYRKRALPRRLHLGDAERRAWQAGARPTRHQPVIGRRYELDALTYLQLVTLIEEALAEHGATAKVVPPPGIVTEMARQKAVDHIAAAIRTQIDTLIDTNAIIDKVAADLVMDEITPETVRAALDTNRDFDWRTVVNHAAQAQVARHDTAITDTLHVAIREAMAA